jgi:hypothetical protein
MVDGRQHTIQIETAFPSILESFLIDMLFALLFVNEKDAFLWAMIMIIVSKQN